MFFHFFFQKRHNSTHQMQAGKPAWAGTNAVAPVPSHGHGGVLHPCAMHEWTGAFRSHPDLLAVEVPGLSRVFMTLGKKTCRSTQSHHGVLHLEKQGNSLEIGIFMEIANFSQVLEDPESITASRCCCKQPRVVCPEAKCPGWLLSQ